MENTHYVSLSETVTVFEPGNMVNSVFYDPSGGQVFTLRSRGAMGVTVKSPTNSEVMNFRIDDHGDVLSVKFSQDNNILAIQRNSNSVDFLAFTNGLPAAEEFSQRCKSKSSSKLLGFVWTTATEILFITTESIELYQINPIKRSTRLLKHYSLATCCYFWDVGSHLLVCSTGCSEIMCHTFCLKTPGSINKMCKFSLKPYLLPSGSENMSDLSRVVQNNCLLVSLYDLVYFLVVQATDDSDQVAGMATTKRMHLFKLTVDGQARVTNVLLLDSPGPVAISLVDNLILAHSQADKTTAVYDIGLSGPVSESLVMEHRPVFAPCSIAPKALSTNSVPLLSTHPDACIPVELYSPTWITSLPNIVMDDNLGCLWTLNLNNEVTPHLISQPSRLADFLFNRSDGKPVVLQHLGHLARRALTDAATYEALSEDDYEFRGGGLCELLDEFAYLFKKMSEVLRKRIKAAGESVGDLSSGMNEPVTPETTNISGLRSGWPSLNSYPFVIELDDIQTSLFFLAQGNDNQHVRQFFFSLLIEYIRSLVEHEVPVDHWFYEQLVSSIARLGNYSQLSYCIQSGFLSDSMPIALQLLSLESVFPAASQLALDMLKRLNCSSGEIAEIFLIKKKLIEALRFCVMNPRLLSEQNDLSQRLLHLAMKSNDKKTFFTIFRFFKHLPPHISVSKSTDHEELLRLFTDLLSSSDSC